VKPAAVRPKQDRRQRGRSKGKGSGRGGNGNGGSKGNGGSRATSNQGNGPKARRKGSGSEAGDKSAGKQDSGGRSDERSEQRSDRPQRSKQQKESKRMDDRDERNESPVSPQEVGDAAVAFMGGLATAFGAESSTELDVDGIQLEVRVIGTELGLMVGPGGRTLMAVQDLARVASQRRLGDHDTRLRIDVGGYREKRREALERFAGAVADQVIDSGDAKALEPMSSADRKTIHDAIVAIDGVDSHSEGDDPTRRVVITPA
jgi:spoIIIJ-associated protein